jgi:FtsH-binding integral membrane protein
VIPTALLVGAVARWPHGYYTALRLVVCFAALLVMVVEYERVGKIGLWIIAFGLVALLFNPVIPVYLTRHIWFYIDLGVAALFAAHSAVIWNTRKDVNRFAESPDT